MIDEKINEKLGKLVTMAKRGTDNEKKNSIIIIKKLCKQYNLIFDDVMTETEIKEFELCYKQKMFKSLAFHIYSRFGVINENSLEFGEYKHGNRIWYKTTLERHVEIINAFEVLHVVFKKEMKLVKESFELAFYNKHKLWYYTTDTDKTNDDEDEEERKKDIEKNILAFNMMGSLQDIEILKRLE